MSKIITTLHPENNPDDSLFPNIVSENIPNGSVEEIKTTFLLKQLNKNICEIIPGLVLGIKTSLNYDTGIATISGTKEGTSNLINIGTIEPKETGTYIFSYVGTSKPTLYIYDNESQVAVIPRASNTVTFTLSSNVVYTLKMYIEPNTTVNYNIGLQIEKGNVASEFVRALSFKLKENIDYEIPLIEPLKTTFIKKVDTINILKLRYNSDFNILCEPNYETGYINISGTKTSAFSRNVIGTIEPKETGTYIFSYVGTSKPTIYIVHGDLIVATIPSLSNTVTFNLEENITYTFEIYIAPNTTVNYNIGLQIEKGTVASEFVNNYRLELDGNIYLSNIKNKLKNKKFSILGVSVDTYYGWIPLENVSYYNSNNLPSVNMTWWYKLMKYTGMELLINNSYSGAKAVMLNNNDISSGVHRCLNLDNGTDNPDIIFVGAFGLNDWISSTIGSFNYNLLIPGINVDLSDNEQYEIYKNTINNYIGAMSTIICRLQNKYKNSEIYVMNSYNYYRNNQHPTGDYQRNMYIINNALKEVCERYGVTIIDINTCGINSFNSKEYCVEPSSSIASLHPNNEGHTLIFNKILKYL